MWFCEEWGARLLGKKRLLSLDASGGQHDPLVLPSRPALPSSVLTGGGPGWGYRVLGWGLPGVRCAQQLASCLI